MALKKSLTQTQKELVSAVFAKVGSKASRKKIIEVSTELGQDFPYWLLSAPFKEYRSKRGIYNLETILAISAWRHGEEIRGTTVLSKNLNNKRKVY